MKRLAWLDETRGLAIVLVVLMHADNVSERLGWDTFTFLDPLWAGFALIRMPVLLLLSGFLLTRSLEKPPGHFLYGKWSLILWPYLVWICIRHLPEVGTVPFWDPEVWFAAGYLWYLFYLFIYYVVALLAKSLRVPALAIAIGFWALSWFDLLLSEFAYFGAFFFLGAVLWSRWPGVKLPTSRWWLLLVAGLAIASWVADASLAQRLPLGATVLFAAAPIALVITLFQRASGLRLLRPLSFVGRNSIVFYVAHFPIVSAGARVLHSFAPDYTDWYWIPLAAAAFAGCTALALWRNKVPITWLFEAPRPLEWIHRRRFKVGPSRTQPSAPRRVGSDREISSADDSR